MLILYFATLLTLFISSKSFLVETSGFLYVVSCILKTDNIISSFLLQMHFLSVSCLITLSGTSNIMLNRIGKSVSILVLFLILEESFQLFTIDCVSCEFVIYGFYETILHLRDKYHLIMVYDLFSVLLKSVFQYFVEDFCIYIRQRYWPQFPCIVLVYIKLWCQSFFLLTLQG